MAVMARPPESQYRMTRAWKDAVLRWLDENDRSKTWLAEQISRRYRVINSSTLTVMFRMGTVDHPEQWTSALVPVISDITGIPMPEMEIVSASCYQIQVAPTRDQRALLEMWERVRAAHPEAAEAILAILRELSRNQK